MIAAWVPELGDAGRSQFLLVRRDIGRAKVDPGSSKGRRVVHDGSLLVFRGPLGELDAEGTPVRKGHQQNRVLRIVIVPIVALGPFWLGMAA